VKLADPAQAGSTSSRVIISAPSFTKRGILAVLIALGGFSAILYFDWWLQHPFGVLTFVVLPLTLLYHTAQIFIPWTLFLGARRVSPPLPQPGLSVDVFVVAYKEPIWLIRKTLKAAVEMRYPHKTFLLDDGRREVLRGLAKRLGAGYITRPDNKHAKAGNINNALQRTRGEIVVIFDTDHTPKPEFLERSLGHFRNPKVGFVQVMETFSNDGESFISRAATETTTEFFGPVCLGMDAWGSCTLFGTNALIRRVALEQIGGYRPGLTEDLATSIELHAEKWESAYVHEALAPGLSPADLRAYFVQQFKWAIGVFDLLLTRYPKRFFRLTPRQRLCYFTRMTCYGAGPYCAAHILLALFLVISNSATHALFSGYAICYLPLFLSILAIQAFSVHCWSAEPARVRWRAISLVYATWPVYLAALFCAFIRRKIEYLPTPKTFRGGNFLPLVIPQMVSVIALVIGLKRLVSETQIAHHNLAVEGFILFLLLGNVSIVAGIVEGLRYSIVE
jgi:cellulose synthase (UDP-forming)